MGRVVCGWLNWSPPLDQPNHISALPIPICPQIFIAGWLKDLFSSAAEKTRHCTKSEAPLRCRNYRSIWSVYYLTAAPLVLRPDHDIYWPETNWLFSWPCGCRLTMYPIEVVRWLVRDISVHSHVLDSILQYSIKGLQTINQVSAFTFILWNLLNSLQKDLQKSTTTSMEQSQHPWVSYNTAHADGQSPTPENRAAWFVPERRKRARLVLRIALTCLFIGWVIVVLGGVLLRYTFV